MFSSASRNWRSGKGVGENPSHISSLSTTSPAAAAAISPPWRWCPARPASGAPWRPASTRTSPSCRAWTGTQYVWSSPWGRDGTAHTPSETNSPKAQFKSTRWRSNEWMNEWIFRFFSGEKATPSGHSLDCCADPLVLRLLRLPVNYGGLQAQTWILSTFFSLLFFHKEAKKKGTQ